MASNNNRQGSVQPRSKSLQAAIDASLAPSAPAGRQSQKPQTIVQANQLDPVSQALTSRYLSQQAGGQGNPAGQRSPHLQQQAADSAGSAEGVIHKDGM